MRYLVLFLGVFACSTAAVQIKASTAHPCVLAAARMLIAALVLAPFAWRDWRTHCATFGRAHLRRTTLPSLVLAAHLITWAYGARMTLTAQASLVVNLAPVAVPFFLHWLVGEKINRTEILGTALALAGVAVLTVRDALAGGGSAAGNAVCFGSMLLFAWYLALGRRNRDFPTLWLYVVPVYAQAGLFCLVVAVPWLAEFPFGSRRELALLAGLALLPTVIGHSVLNASMRHLRAQVVSVCNVGQFVFAGVMAYFLFGETPSAVFYAAGALVVAGVGIVVFSAPSAPPRLR